MATDGPPVERLRGYLSQLPTAKRTQLIAELEGALLRGDEVPGGDLLLQEVRSSVRESAQRAPRISPAAISKMRWWMASRKWRGSRKSETR